MPLGYFTDSTPLTPLRDPFNVLVDGINAVETAVDDLEDSRALQTFRWADAAERSAQTGMVAGDIGYQQDNSTTYTYRGSAWVPVLEDTGWTPITTFSNGWSANPSYPVAIRRKNGLVMLRGRLAGGSTGVAFTLPDGFRPSSQLLFSGVDGGSATARAWIFINNINYGVQLQTGQAPQIDQVTFFADA